MMKWIIKSDFYLCVIQWLIFLYWYEKNQIHDHRFHSSSYNTQIMINQINIKCQILILFLIFENFNDNLLTNFFFHFLYFSYDQIIYLWLLYYSIVILIFRSFVCNLFIWFVIKIVFHVFFHIIFFIWCFWFCIFFLHSRLFLKTVHRPSFDLIKN